jgi:DNA-binding NarL/FixJ family response regulator
MIPVDALRRGRDSFARSAWADAYAQLATADQETPIEPEDLERLATAAYLVGRDAESERIWVRAHQEFLNRSDVERAARCAFWLAFALLNRAEQAHAAGWVARAGRLLDDAQRNCVERGYLLLPGAVRSVYQGELAGAYTTFSQAAELGERFGDRALVAFARHGQGRALMRMGELERGVSLLDEAMAAVEAGEVSPLMAGDIYCSVIEACHECFDIRRAQEWTTALARWCESQPDIVPYRGQCLVRHAEVLQLHGEWHEAAVEAQRACEWLLRPPPQRSVGAAFYRRGELHRLRGEFGEAEEAYREASQWGRKPEPGFALLRLAQGQTDAAAAAVRRAVDEANERQARSRLLLAYIEIMLATGDLQSARAAAGELAEISDDLGAPLLRTMASQAQGTVLLAEGDARAALAVLRHAATAWQEIEAPYESARVRVLIGLACRELADHDTAEIELGAARRIFQQLGAAPDLARVEQLSRRAASRPAGGLTTRERQVLRLVAAGKTNRVIAADLCISERTVDRHVSNIFTKLALSSRSAATAYAYEHDLL